MSNEGLVGASHDYYTAHGPPKGRSHFSLSMRRLHDRRGIDQALPHPVNPVLYEPCVRDAREYVALAEKANGPISRPLSADYVWGEALHELERANIDLRIVNLETAITSVETRWPEKGIH